MNNERRQLYRAHPERPHRAFDDRDLTGRQAFFAGVKDVALIALSTAILVGSIYGATYMIQTANAAKAQLACERIATLVIMRVRFNDIGQTVLAACMQISRD